MLTTIQAEQSDADKLKGIAQRTGKPLEQVLHEAVETLEKFVSYEEDHDFDKAFDEAATSEKVQSLVSELDSVLKSKALQ